MGWKVASSKVSFFFLRITEMTDSFIHEHFLCPRNFTLFTPIFQNFFLSCSQWSLMNTKFFCIIAWCSWGSCNNLRDSQLNELGCWRNNNRQRQYLPKGVMKAIWQKNICQNPDVAFGLENTTAPSKFANMLSTARNMCLFYMTTIPTHHSLNVFMRGWQLTNMALAIMAQPATVDARETYLWHHQILYYKYVLLSFPIFLDMLLRCSE